MLIIDANIVLIDKYLLKESEKSGKNASEDKDITD
jgi:hypothetical protein